MFQGLAKFYRGTFGQAATGALLLWLALPLPPSTVGRIFGPLAPNVDTGASLAGQAPLPGPWYATLAWLAWIAPAWWVMLARRRRMPGRRPYRALWLVGFLFWLTELYWLTLPYWATSAGWVALSFYLAFYLPIFVGLVRVAVHRLRISVILAAPVVWTGLELARAHVITGFTMASLGHTQYRWLEMIQLSDLFGAFGVGFVMMLVAACLARMVPLGDESAEDDAREPAAKPSVTDRRWSLWPLAPAAVVVAASLVYGHMRIDGRAAQQDEDVPAARIALIQGSIDTEMKADPEMQQQVMDQYARLSGEAATQYGDLDLMVWPETMFRIPTYTYDPEAGIPPGWSDSPDAFAEWIKEATAAGPKAMALVARRLDTPLLLGIDAYEIGADKIGMYNSAAFISATGKVIARYDKMHPVMFGEYIPFSRYIPLLEQITPLGPGLTEGQLPVSVEVGPLRVAPNICYESVLSHVVRGPIERLAAKDLEPDVMVNLTNDGWFWGSSELDLHLICGVFRAVECRKPMLIAANTGFSAWIDGDGRIVAMGPRRATGTILAEVRPDSRKSWYLVYGDWPAGLCLAACIALALAGWWTRPGKAAARQAA